MRVSLLFGRLLPLLLLSACAVGKVSIGVDTGGSTGFDSGTGPPDGGNGGGNGGNGGGNGGDSGTDTGACSGREFPGHVIDVDETCKAARTAPAWTLREAWTHDLTYTWYATPVVAELDDDNRDGRVDGDDVPDVVVLALGELVAISGDDGRELWSVSSSTGGGTTPAVGDIDGDGLPDVVYGSGHDLLALRGASGSQEWKVSLGSTSTTALGAVGLADFDGDGRPEPFLGASIFDGRTGAEVATGDAGDGTLHAGAGPLSIAADLDLDGTPELIAGNAAYEPDGRTYWVTGGEDGAPAVGNFDGDEEGEVFVSSPSSGRVLLLDSDGTELWSHDTSSGGAVSGPPVVADLDGDGRQEAAVVIGGKVTVYDRTGATVWTASITDGGVRYDGLAAYDLDGDGASELLVGDAKGLTIFDGASGDVRATWSAKLSPGWGNYPSVADVDGDGHADIVLIGGTSETTSVTVVQDADDAFASSGIAWNEHGFSPTDLDADGRVLAHPDPSWLAGGGSRAGGPALHLNDAPDIGVAIDDVCEDECAAGDISVWYTISNRGVLDLNQEFIVRFYGVTGTENVYLGSDAVDVDVPSGKTANAREARLTGVPSDLYDVLIIADGAVSTGSDDVIECDELDNEAAWGSPVCLR